MANKRLNVLVVDDLKDAADSLVMLLQLWGHDVKAAYGAAAALEMADECHPEVVLLDIGMPRMDGFQVGRRLRLQLNSELLLLVAISGYTSAAHHRTAREVGFDHYLVKPVDLECLRQMLAETARSRRTSAADPVCCTLIPFEDEAHEHLAS